MNAAVRIAPVSARAKSGIDVSPGQCEAVVRGTVLVAGDQPPGLRREFLRFEITHDERSLSSGILQIGQRPEGIRCASL